MSHSRKTEAGLTPARKTFISKTLRAHLTTPELIASDLNKSEWFKYRDDDDVLRHIDPNEAQALLRDFAERAYETINSTQSHMLSGDIQNTIVKYSLADVLATRGQIEILDRDNDIDITQTKTQIEEEKRYAAEEYGRISRTLMPGNALSFLELIERHDKSLNLSPQQKEGIISKLLLVRNEQDVNVIFRKYFSKHNPNDDFITELRVAAQAKPKSPNSYHLMLAQLPKTQETGASQKEAVVSSSSSTNAPDDPAPSISKPSSKNIPQLKEAIEHILKLHDTFFDPSGIKIMLKIINNPRLSSNEQWNSAITSAYGKAIDPGRRKPILQEFYLRVSQLHSGIDPKNNLISRESLDIAHEKINRLNLLLKFLPELKNIDVGREILITANGHQLTIDEKLKEIREIVEKANPSTKQEKDFCASINRYIQDLENPQKLKLVNPKDYPTLKTFSKNPPAAPSASQPVKRSAVR